MRKESSYSFRQLFLQLLFAFSFLACQFNGHASHSSAAEDGTSHGGGGNGAGDNRVFEGHEIDPLQLEAAKTYILPLLEKLNAPTGYDNFDWKVFFKLKTWYLLPLKMKPIDNQNLGVSFSKDQTQQLAYQTEREVWLDSDIYQKMTREDQAELILHEMVMTVYFIKFMKYTEECESMRRALDLNNDCHDDAGMDQISPKEPARPLQADDYANIRAVTSWLWDHRDSASQKDIYQEFLSNSFDEMLFSSFLDSTRSKTDLPQLTTADMRDIFAQAKALGLFPSQCRGLNQGTSLPCTFDYKEVPLKFSNGPVPLPGLNFQEMGSGFSWNQNIYIAGPIYPFQSHDLVTHQERVFLPVMAQGLDKPEIGDTFRSNFVVLEPAPKTSLGYRLRGLISIPGVVTKVTPGTQPFQGDICEGAAPRTMNVDTDILAIVAPDENTQYIKWLFNSISGLTPPCFAVKQP